MRSSCCVSYTGFDFSRGNAIVIPKELHSSEVRYNIVKRRNKN